MPWNMLLSQSTVSRIPLQAFNSSDQVICLFSSLKQIFRYESVSWISKIGSFVNERWSLNIFTTNPDRPYKAPTKKHFRTITSTDLTVKWGTYEPKYTPNDLKEFSRKRRPLLSPHQVKQRKIIEQKR